MSGGRPARSVATISLPAAQTNAAPPESTSGRVPGSRWSRCAWLEVTTSTKERPRRLDDEPGDALVQHARLVAGLAQRVGEIRVEQDVLLRHLHEEAALPEPPDVHAAIVGRGPDLGDEILAGEDRVDPVGRLLVEGVARRPRHGAAGEAGDVGEIGQRLGGPAAERGEQPATGRRAGWKERVGIVGHGVRGRGTQVRGRAGDRSQRSDRSNGSAAPSRASGRQTVAAAGCAAAAATTAAAAPVESRSVLTTMSYCVGSSAFSPKNRLR